MWVAHMEEQYERGWGNILKKDTGISLGHAIAKELSGSIDFDEMAEKKMYDAVNIIKSFRINAIEHHDLEYQLIKKTPPYNRNGK